MPDLALWQPHPCVLRRKAGSPLYRLAKVACGRPCARHREARALDRIGRVQRLLIAFLVAAPLSLAAIRPEVRGVWVDRAPLASRESIRAMLGDLRGANCNAVFVNVWSRGYPLWRSALFERHTASERAISSASRWWVTTSVPRDSISAQTESQEFSGTLQDESP